MKSEEEVEFARAVVAGDAVAVARFERECLATIDGALAHMRLDAATVDEVRQRVRQRLLLAADDGVARLVSYAGDGKLEGLVVVTATRIALDLVRERKREGDRDGPSVAEALADRGDDPLLTMMKERAREGFRSAFAKAVDGLEPRDRNLLKLHLLRGVSLEKLAEMYSVHRATVVRWLAEARAKVLSATRKELERTLGERELAETVALIESQLDASIERLFRTRG
ncbi:MAG: sigma-70 family RNA polymerase sigma factor [Polyangiales bacterium]